MNAIVWDNEAYVCSDCYMLIGSGDLSSFDYWYGDDAETKRQELYANIEATLAPETEVRAPDGSVWTQAHGKLHITLGRLREMHECATNYTVTTTLADGTSTTEDIRSDETYLGDVINDLHCGLVALEIGDSITITRRELQAVSEQGGECDCETDTSRSDACASCGQYLQHATMYAVTVWEGSS